MNENINKGLVFGSQFLALILVITGTILQQSQLKSSRPPSIGGPTSNLATTDQNLQLWQDPLDSYQANKPTLIAPVANPEESLWSLTLEMKSKTSPSTKPIQPTKASLDSIIGRAQVPQESVSQQWIFWNIIDPRPTTEFREIRLRARYAVVSTLASAGFQPVIDSTLVRMPYGDSLNPKGFLEIFQLEKAGDETPMVERAYVCWVPNTSQTTTTVAPDPPNDPTQEIAAYLRDINPEALKNRTRIVILNHGNSNRLKEYVIHKKNPIKPADENHPHHYTVFVRATIPPKRLGNSQPWTNKLQAVATDDLLIKRLTGELKLRIPSLANRSTKERIIIFTESDGDYGHNLAGIISEQMGKFATVEVYSYLKGLDGLADETDSKSTKYGLSSKPEPLPTSAFSEKCWGTSQYDYLMRLAASLKSDSSETSPIVAIGILGSDVYDKLLVLQAVHQQLPELTYFTTDLDGVYLNRENLSFTRNLIIASGEGLSPMSPTKPKDDHNPRRWKLPPMRDSYQVALTRVINGLISTPVTDAWQPAPEPPKAWEVGSGTLLELPNSPDDPDQCLMKVAAWPLFTPAIFTLGLLNGLLILLAASARMTPQGDTKSMLRSSAYRFLYGEALVAGGLLLIVMGLIAASLMPESPLARELVLSAATAVVLLIALRWSRERSRGGQRRLGQLLRDQIGTTALWLLAVLLTLAAMLQGPQTNFLFGEPLGLISGTGIWPSIVLRLAAFLVGLMLLAFTSKIFVEQGAEMRTDLEHAASLPLEASANGGAMILIRLFDSVTPPIPRWLKKEFILNPLDPPVSAVTASTSKLTLCLNRCFDPERRVRRVVLMALIYFAFSMLLFTIWKPSVPARGGATFVLEKFSISAGVGLYIIHLCFCVELHCCAYEIINRITTALPHRDTAASDTPLADRDLRIIARGVGRLTRIVGVTLLYPLTILSLILLSRLRLFDDWTMTPSLVFTLLIGVAVLVTVSLMIVFASLRCRGKVQRLLAHRLAALEVKLASQRLANAVTGREKRASALEAELKKLSDEIERLSKYQEGAFAPWYSQPIFVAILATVAVFGSLGVADSVMSLFIG
jgi:hypothetical protein